MKIKTSFNDVITFEPTAIEHIGGDQFMFFSDKFYSETYEEYLQPHIECVIGHDIK